MWGATTYVLEPGEASRYHWHVGEEEWLVVLEGAPTLRTPEGDVVLGPWDTTVFPRGEAGAHQLRNDTDRPVRAVFFSTVSDPEVCIYPDEGRTGVIAGWTRGEPLRGWVVEP
jgi:uncharacterized cupin superfamily protein